MKDTAEIVMMIITAIITMMMNMIPWKMMTDIITVIIVTIIIIVRVRVRVHIQGLVLGLIQGPDLVLGRDTVIITTIQWRWHHIPFCSMHLHLISHHHFRISDDKNSRRNDRIKKECSNSSFFSINSSFF